MGERLREREREREGGHHLEEIKLDKSMIHWFVSWSEMSQSRQ